MVYTQRCDLGKGESYWPTCTHPREVVNQIDKLPPTIAEAPQLISSNSRCDSPSCFSSSLPWFWSRNADGSRSLRKGKSLRQRSQGRSLASRGSQGSQNRRQANQSLQPSTMQSITLSLRIILRYWGWKLRFRWTAAPTGGTCWWNLARWWPVGFTKVYLA